MTQSLEDVFERIDGLGGKAIPRQWLLVVAVRRNILIAEDGWEQRAEALLRREYQRWLVEH